ncbi:putative mannose-1-phosphate guanylyl transferase [metagenome]|uniref:Putative mannose-1-phosphate guanylyl transferase n=1 Tax=metagenome TaxID=256318 RepID=A0A2P2CBR3_9ZZZZ
MPANAAPIPGFWAVIPAGGAGTRLWPLSRSARPKFLHDLTGTGSSLLQDTVERLAPLSAERVVVVTGLAHRTQVLEQLALLAPEQVIGEPSPRDSMPAIGLAAARLERLDPDAVLGSFAADHVIYDTDAFAACVRRAVVAAREDWLVTIGIEPTHPATAFGYIHQGPELPGLAGVHQAREFVEKPTAEVAAAYVASGDYRWNAGMFVVRPRVLLDLLALNHPDLVAGLRAIASGERELADGWPELTRIAIDHAVAEPAAAQGRVAMVPGDFGWRDIGDFAALGDLLPATGGLKVLGDPALVRGVEASGLVVAASGRTVTVVGLEDVVVVDTGDALLVTTRERAQEVKQVVDLLRADGLDDLL